jgi:hypothetical protein
VAKTLGDAYYFDARGRARVPQAFLRTIRFRSDARCNRGTLQLTERVVWKLVSRLDYLIMSSLKTGSGSLLRATTCDLLDILWNRRRLDYELVKQVAAQTTYAAGRVNYSFATDEAHVGGPSLFNTVVVYKDNTALLMCPLVRPIQ